MRCRAGTTLLVLILLAWLGMEWSRPLLRTCEAPPAPVVSGSGAWVLLGKGFPDPGVHHFSDAVTVSSVIALTSWPLGSALQNDPCLKQPLETGAALDLVVQDSEIKDIIPFWMSAGKRLSLGVALHPDRMSRSDWETLRGLGPVLAQKIEENRQQNGDFGSLEALQRVRGIGAARIASWKQFFR